jgi:phosphohistidine phosphatase
MKLVLVRHAEAEGMRATDAERALTARGHAQAAETAQWLRQQLDGVASLQLLVSPYRRARETAAAFAEVLALSPVFLDELTPDIDPRRALLALDDVVTADVVVIVTHMPLVAALASWLEHGVLSSGAGFMLAEARVLEADVLGAATAQTQSRHVPDFA